VNEIRRAIYQRLNGDATLPVVVFNRQAGTPLWAFDSAHIQSDLWQVKAVDKNPSASRAEDIAARIDELLTDQPIAVDDHTLLAIYRESDVEFLETDDGLTYHHVGALYRVQTQPA
jgi:hypothetical protein